MKGWIKIHRKLLDSNMYRSLNSKQRDVMFACLMMANHAENEWEWEGNVYKCMAGQFVSSLDKIRKNCSNDVKVQSVRTALLKLEKWGFLTNKSTKTGRLVTICKWAEYQDTKDTTNKDSNKHLTKNQQRSNKELTPNKNVKNNKNEKNDKEYIETTQQKFNFKSSMVHLGVEKDILSDWLEVRSKKKASNTRTAFNAIESQLRISPLNVNDSIRMAVENDWKGFNAQWVKNKLESNGTNRQVFNKINGITKQQKLEQSILNEVEAIKRGEISSFDV